MYFELIVRFFIAPLLPKKDCEAQLGGFLNGLESPPRRCRGLLPSAHELGTPNSSLEMQEPRSSVCLVDGAFSWSPQAAAAARN